MQDQTNGEVNAAPADLETQDGPSWQRWGIPVLSLIAVAAAIVAFWAAEQAKRSREDIQLIELGPEVDESGFQGFVVEPPKPAPDFELTDTTGNPFGLSDLEGEAVLVFFGYTHCPDVCPMTMVKLADAVAQLGSEKESTRVVFISVDPDRDTPEKIESYLGGYELSAAPAANQGSDAEAATVADGAGRLVGLTGTDEELTAVAESFGVQFWKDVPEGMSEPPENYTMTHSGRVFLIDPQGRLRASFLGLFEPDQVAHDVRLVLEESG